jgi:L-methionine (R)-S-oxide reductase
MFEADSEATTWLEAFLTARGAVSGTVHRLRTEAEGEPALELVAAVRIPEKVIAVTRTIPRGRGMAGLAWERGVAVSTCNLTTDTTGDVRPGAKAVDAKAAAALPVFDARGELKAVVGVAWNDERELDDATLASLAEQAATLP